VRLLRIRLRLNLGFEVQEESLAALSPAVPGRIAPGVNDPVARDNEGGRIRGAGSRDRPRSRRLAQRGRDFAVRPRRARRNPAKLLPNPGLKSRSLNVQRENGGGSGAGKIGQNSVDGGLHGAVIFRNLGFGEFASQ
jgi:hypothetical protein